MATVADLVTVATTPTLLWQTSTGVSPDPAPVAANQIFRAGTRNDPIPIYIENTDATNAVYLGGSGVTTSTGISLAHGVTQSYSVIGNDSVYAISAGSVVVAVSAGRQ